MIFLENGQICEASLDLTRQIWGVSLIVMNAPALISTHQIIVHMKL